MNERRRRLLLSIYTYRQLIQCDKCRRCTGTRGGCPQESAATRRCRDAVPRPRWRHADRSNMQRPWGRRFCTRANADRKRRSRPI